MEQPLTTARYSQTRENILGYIRRFVGRHSYAPSIRQIAEGVGLRSSASVHRHLEVLEAEGRIRREKNCNRAIMLTEAGGAEDGAGSGDADSVRGRGGASSSGNSDSANVVELEEWSARHANAEAVSPSQFSSQYQVAPIVGDVAAGLGTIAEENIDGAMTLPVELCGRGELFVLKVRGDSMQDAAILDGDYVVVRQQNTADNDDIVVAGINEDEATVKRFRKSGSPAGSRVTLLAENEAFEPMEFPASEVAIYGKVVSVMRQL